MSVRGAATCEISLTSTSPSRRLPRAQRWRGTPGRFQRSCSSRLRSVPCNASENAWPAPITRVLLSSGLPPRRAVRPARKPVVDPTRHALRTTPSRSRRSPLRIIRALRRCEGPTARDGADAHHTAAFVPAVTSTRSGAAVRAAWCRLRVCARSGPSASMIRATSHAGGWRHRLEPAGQPLFLECVRPVRRNKRAPVERRALCRRAPGREQVAPPPARAREGDEIIDPRGAVTARAA